MLHYLCDFCNTTYEAELSEGKLLYYEGEKQFKRHVIPDDKEPCMQCQEKMREEFKAKLKKQEQV